VPQEKRPVTVITGASAGIGAALVQEFAANGHDLVVVARREPALVALADTIAAKGAPRPAVLAVDVARADAVEVIAEALDQRSLEPEVIVNNAGAGLTGAADKLDRAEQLAVIDLNVRALTDLSLAFVDSLKRRRGGILNVASLAAFMPGPGRAVYYASKAFVLSFSEAPHRELKPHGVRVTVLCPGPVPTALQARAGMTGVLPRLFMRSAEEVAREAYRGLSQGRRMVVPGLANRAMTTAIRLSPRSLWLELIAHARPRFRGGEVQRESRGRAPQRWVPATGSSRGAPRGDERHMGSRSLAHYRCSVPCLFSLLTAMRTPLTRGWTLRQ
jgi:short-subunit dehydrogenase